MRSSPPTPCDRHAGGKIVESWFIPDRFTLWQQLGLMPSQPG
jgi:hypothetical protein